MPERAFADYLRSSLAQIERDVPAIHDLVRRCLGRLALRIEVDAEAVTVRDDGARLAIGSEAEADVVARTGRRAIVALVDGELSLEEAVSRGDVDLVGEVGHLLAGLDALVAYLNGAARCPELLDLMDEFRRDTEARAG
ncbi:MAG: hypothetical protein QM820_45715 [Minicystis sp.]